MIDILSKRNTLSMIFQTEMAECGLACLAMIANYYGKHSDIRMLRESLCMPAGGSSVRHVLEAGLKLELQGRPLKLELQEVASLTLPAILHWDTDHFVVLSKTNRRSVVVHDPAMGIRRYTLAELGCHFTGIAIELFPCASFTQEKPSKEYTLKEFFRVTPKFHQAMAQVFFLSLLLQVLLLIFPLYLQLVIDQGLGKGDTDIVLLVAMLFSLVILAKTAVSFFRGLLVLQFSNQLGFQMVSSTFSHLLSLPLSYFDRREMGDIVSRFSSLDTIKQLVTQEMITVTVDGIFSLLTLILLFLYSPTLAFVALFFVCILALIRLLSIPRERSCRQEILQTGAKQQTRFMENIRCMSVTKSYGIESDRLYEWQNHYAQFINASYRLGHFQLSIGSVQSLLSGVDHIATIYLGAVAIFSGHLTIGQLMSFVFLKQNFTVSISAMLPKIAEIRLLKLELDRVSDIAFAEPESKQHDSRLHMPQLSGAMQAKRLGFSYSPERSALFKDISFTLNSGDFLAVTGSSGCGKSTLLKLLLGLDMPTQGEVQVDGLSISTIGLKQLRSQLAAVLHNDSLLAGSLAYNVNLELEPLNNKRLKEACQRACIYDDIDQLPMGFNTQVGEMGAALSAGQVQRILLARALYRQPRILILDEALSHLGDDMASQVITNILELQITLILVTHNPQLNRLADFFLQLDGGEDAWIEKRRLGYESIGRREGGSEND